jgi:hypothetical protein
MFKYDVSEVVTSLGLAIYVVGCKCYFHLIVWLQESNIHQTDWGQCYFHLSARSP